MKTLILSLVLLSAIFAPVARAQEVIVAPVGGDSGGNVSTTPAGAFQFIYPVVDEAWVAGTPHGVKYFATNFNGYANLTFLRKDADGSYYQYWSVPSFLIEEDGYGADAFIVPLFLGPGSYKILLSGWDWSIHDEVETVSSATIRILTPIISPAENQVVKVGKGLRVKFAAPFRSPDRFEIYLKGKTLEEGRLRLGTMMTTQQSKLVKIPKTVSSGEYHIEFVSYYQGSIKGDTFIVSNPKIPSPYPLDPVVIGEKE